jgi:prepilin-type processing-associated H-X9-DG protein
MTLPKKSFSLIELLAVFAILLVLVSLLQPSFKTMVQKAHVLECQSNLKQHGHALAIYTEDHDGYYPQVRSWEGLSGKRGNSRTYGAIYHSPEQKPLNSYLGNNYQLSECPSDLGDGLTGANKAFDAYGTSYLIQLNGNFFRVKHLFHNTNPVHRSEIERTDNKIVMADWPWHPNRTLSMPKSRWHSPDTRSYNTLFADGHSELLFFPIEYENRSWSRLPYDPNFTFW